MKKILITGGTGFLGRYLAKKLKTDYAVTICGRNNTQNSFAQMLTGCEAVPLDVSNIESVRDVFNKINPDYVIHAAATKFVDISEKEPFEAVDVNVVGSENIARVAIEKKCKIVIGISTDKAAPPISNTYALTKSLMEKMFCSVNGRNGTKFSCVRFGNIAWSSGSVFPIWRKMVQLTGKIQTTGPHMRRYLISVSDAADLVIRSLNNIDRLQGSVLIQSMKAIQMIDILELFAQKENVVWEKIDSRQGEREDEYLLGESELMFSEETIIDDIVHYKYTPNKIALNPLTKILSTKTAEHFSHDEMLNFINLEKNITSFL